MSDVNANIRVNVDTSGAIKDLQALQAKVAQIGKTQVTPNIYDKKSIASQIKQLDVATATLQDRLDRRMIGISEGFSNAAEAAKKSFTGKNGVVGNISEANTQMALAEARANKFGDALQKIKSQGLVLDDKTLTKFSAQANSANQAIQLMYRNLDIASTKLINFGKNTQWAGRQLMVGLTLPLTIFGVTAGKVFKDLDREIVNFQRVYGDLGTSAAETDAMTESVKELAVELTKYGQSVQQTLQLAGDIAATGASGDELIARTTQTTRLATLGMIDQQQAMDATISMQAAFAMSNEELAQSINFLNAVENQTVLALEDVTEAIPRAATVIKGLGGDIQDMAVLLTAMREGGIQAVDGAMALKSGLARLITPTKAATKAAEKYGISLNKMINDNRGDLMGLIEDFGEVLSTLDNFGKQEVLSKVFGKYQFARFGALFENISREGSQAQRALELTGMSVQELANLADKELGAIENSVGIQFTASIERFKAALAPVGELFLKIATPIVNFGTKILEIFNSLPDGVKSVGSIAAVIVGAVVPAVTMLIGLIANLAGQLVKGFAVVSQFFLGIMKGGDAVKYLTQEEQDLMIVQGLATGLMQKQQEQTLQTALAFDQLAASIRGATGAYSAYGGAGAGGVMPPMKFATGGRVPGYGTQDTVPALLTPGEFVVNKGAAQGNGAFLQALNSGAVRNYAFGGWAEQIIKSVEGKTSSFGSLGKPGRQDHGARARRRAMEMLESSITDAFVKGGEEGATALASSLEQDLEKTMRSVMKRVSEGGVGLEEGDIGSIKRPTSFLSRAGGRISNLKTLDKAHDIDGLVERAMVGRMVSGSRGSAIDDVFRKTLTEQVNKTGGVLSKGGKERLDAQVALNASLQTLVSLVDDTSLKFGLFGEALSNSILNLPQDMNRLAASGTLTRERALGSISSEGVGWRQGTNTMRGQLMQGTAGMSQQKAAEYAQEVELYAEQYWNAFISQIESLPAGAVIDDPKMSQMAGAAREAAATAITGGKNADAIIAAHKALGDQISETDISLQYYSDSLGKWVSGADAQKAIIQDVATKLSIPEEQLSDIKNLPQLAEFLDAEVERLGDEASAELIKARDGLKKVSFKGDMMLHEGQGTSVKHSQSSERKASTEANYNAQLGAMEAQAIATFERISGKASAAAKEAASSFVADVARTVQAQGGITDEALRKLFDSSDIAALMGADEANDYLAAVKREFGIASPSREMEQIGDDINLGLAQGLESSRGVVLSEAEQTAEAIKATIMGANPTGTGYSVPGVPKVGKGGKRVKENTKAIEQNTAAQKGGLDAIRGFSYAMSAVSSVTMFLPGKFQELASKVMAASFAFTGLIEAYSLMSKMDLFKKGGSGTTIIPGMEGISKAFKKLKSRMGPLGSAIDKVTSIFKSIGSKGKTSIFAAIAALIAAAGTFTFGLRHTANKLDDLAKAAGFTKDEIENLGGVLGFTPTANVRQNGLSATSGEQLDLAARAKQAASEDSDRVKRIAEASEAEATAALATLFTNMVNSGATREQADAFVKAIAQEAGRRKAYVPVIIEYDDDGNISNFDEVISSSLVPSIKVLQEEMQKVSDMGGVFDQDQVSRTMLMSGLLKEIPDEIKTMIPGVGKLEAQMLNTNKAARLLGESVNASLDMIAQQFATTGNVEQFNAQIATMRTELQSLPQGQGLIALKSSFAQLYPQLEGNTQGVKDFDTAMTLAQASAAGFDVSGLIAGLNAGGDAAIAAAAKVNAFNAAIGGLAELQGLQSDAAGIQAELNQVNAQIDAEAAARDSGSGTGGGGGGSKDPFAARENKIRDALAKITIKEIEIDRGEAERFRDDLEERLSNRPVKMPLDIDGEIINIETIADAEYAIEQMGEEIEEIEKQMKPFEDQIEAIEDNIAPARVELESINGVIEDQRDNIERVNEEYDALLKPLEDQRKTIESIVDGLEQQADIAAEPFDNKIKYLEDTLKMEEYAAEKQLDAMEDQKDSLEDQKDVIDDRIQALEKTARINEYIARQQQNQLSLADALSRGDIGAAAAAQQKAQEDAMQMAADMQKEQFENAKDNIDSEIELIEQQEEAINDRLEALEDEIKEQEYQKWLVTKTYEDQIDAQQKILKNIDRQTKSFERQRDAAIAPYQKIIDDYAPRIRELENFIRDNEAEIDRIRRESLKPLEDAVEARQEEQEILQDTISDTQSYTARLKANNDEKRRGLELNQKELAARKELANLSSGGGGGGGGVVGPTSEELQAKKKELEDALKAINDRINEIMADLANPAAEGEGSWWERLLEQINGALAGVMTLLEFFNQLNIRVAKTMAAVALLLFGPAIQKAIQELRSAWAKIETAIIDAWTYAKEAAKAFLDWLKLYAEPVYNVLMAAMETMRLAWELIRKAAVAAFDKLKEYWVRWWNWAGETSVEKMALDIKNFFTVELPETIEDAKDYVAEKFGELVAKMREPLDELVEWLEEKLTGKDNIFVQAANAIKGMAQGVVQSIKTMLKPLMDGIDWIVNMKNRIVSAGEGVVNAIPRPFSKGGPVPGSGNSDTIPAMLTPGEFVIKKSSAQALGMPILNALNEGKFPVAEQPVSARGIMGSVKNTNNFNNSNVNVNASSANAYEVAQIVMREINLQEGRNVK